MFWDQIRHGEEPTLIKAADRFDYYDALQNGRPLNRNARLANILKALADIDPELPKGWTDSDIGRIRRG